MSSNRPPDFRVRIPEDLKEKIRASAEEYNRSMGADIIARLEASFVEDEAQPQAAMNVVFDDDWFDETGLSKEEFGAFVRMAVQSGVSQYKVDHKDD